MTLKVYADRMSQPSRAVLIFAKANGIDFEEIRVDVLKHDQFSPEYEAINPMSQVPAIVDADGRFKLFESHAILIYLACAYPGVADHWYPADLFRRARIHSVLDWHHSNLRRGAAGLIFSTILAPMHGLRSNTNLAEADASEKILVKSLSKLENFWLEENAPFLLGSSQPSIADVSLVCEIMQLELLSEKAYHRILSPYKKVLQWIEDTKSATRPHFDDIHGILYKIQKRRRERLATQFADWSNGGWKTEILSEM